MDGKPNYPKNTAICGFLTCLAYEAVRIMGWQYRHAVSGGVWDPGGSDPTLLEIAVNTWEPDALMMYLAFMAPLLVVFSNPSRVRIQQSWFVVSLVALFATTALIPFSKNSRILSTDSLVALIYSVVIVLPSIFYIAYGLYTAATKERIQTED